MITEVSAEKKCDFCCQAKPIWRYPCRSFEMKSILGLPWGSVGDFAACDGCSTLVEQNRRHDLAVVALFAYRQPMATLERSVILACIRSMHDQFFENRLGPRVGA